MRKIILLLGILFIANSAAFADCEYQCVAPYDMNNKFMSALSTVSGLNFAHEKIAQSIMKKNFSKIAKGDDISYKIESYSSKDLKKGIFKSMSIKGKNLSVDDIYLSSLDIHTLCDFNYVKQVGKDIVFVEDFPLSVGVKISASDINKTMKSEKYQKIIDDLNKLGMGGIKISSTSVSIKSDKFYYTIGVAFPFVKQEKKVSITADLKVKDGKIDFDNTRLTSKSLSLDLSKIDFILNYLNPLDFSIKILDNKDTNISIQNIEIEDNIITADAIAVIPKD